jgi:hypothetical protein
MKTLIIFIFLCITLISNAQKEIKLTVKQPPEFGFLVSKQDTTIEKGRSVILGTDLVIFGGSAEYHYSWSPGTTLDDSTFFNPLATPTDTTVYVLTVTDSFGCSFSINYKVYIEPLVNTEIITISEKLQAVLFPNPNEGKFRVKLTGIPSERIELSVNDISGKVIKRQTIRNFSGDHTEIIQLKLISGVYILLIDSGSETLSRQFIIY